MTTSLSHNQGLTSSSLSFGLKRRWKTSAILCSQCTVIINASDSAHTTPVSSYTMFDLMQILRPSLRATSPCHAYVCPFLTGFKQRTLSSEVATSSQLQIIARTPAFWSMMVAVAPPCWMLGCPQSGSLGEKMQYALVILLASISACLKKVLQKQNPDRRSRMPQSRNDLWSCIYPFMMLCFSSLPKRWW